MIIPELASPVSPAAPLPAAPRPQVRATVRRSARPSGYSAKKLAAIAGGVIALGVLYYFGLGWADAFQKHFNEKQRQIAANSGGGTWPTSPSSMRCLTVPSRTPWASTIPTAS